MESEKELLTFEKQETAIERPEQKPRVETPEGKKEREVAEAKNHAEAAKVGEVEEQPKGAASLSASGTSAPTHPPVNPAIVQRVETVLEDGIGPIFVKLRPEEQDMIKAEGERIAIQIAELIASAKATAVRVFKLIVQWLSIIPGISKWFIQQEAKIKTDTMMKIQK